MSRPTQDLEWAEDLKVEYMEKDGESVLLFNKVEPSVAFKQSGFRVRGPLFRSYLNYIIDALCKHVRWSIEGEVGAVRFENTSATVASVEVKYGGTWVDQGTTTLGSTTKRVFEKVA